MRRKFTLQLDEAPIYELGRPVPVLGSTQTGIPILGCPSCQNSNLDIGHLTSIPITKVTPPAQRGPWVSASSNCRMCGLQATVAYNLETHMAHTLKSVSKRMRDFMRKVPGDNSPTRFP